MRRRDFFKSAAAGAVATSSLAAPAIAQSMPEVKWRLSSAFPKSLDILYGTGETLARHVAEATDGRFQIQSFAAGEIVGTMQALDAISNGTVEMTHTSSYYYTGKSPVFALITSVPFGMNARQQNAWMNQGGGIDMCNKFLANYNVYALPGGHTGTQMGGWFRKEINTVDDLRGLKFRVAGMAGQILSTLGVVPQQLAPGDIYPALERGSIDAVEFSGPYDDEKLGFQKVAPYYYYPGFWEGGPTTHFMFNLQKWNELPKHYRAALRDAAAFANTDMTAKYDTRNPMALRKLISAGAQLRPFKPEIMEASFKAANSFYEDLCTKDASFKAMWESYSAFRDEEYLWFQVAEFSYDNFMIRMMRTRS
ncbi:TRAP transporter substrate-binding protein [Microvirga aerophila]|uniref:ABC transporter substrate-binding protein n=1 Tax=Microvirga aerophila TaxID=670291 RepID=A0A512BXL8_9HYPH|nr:TRAP transporter substrate-binding protein [Microvirga aerophila]GEO16699.1 ABC transporter substrate-binding protein [Microvirga aerophila]